MCKKIKINMYTLYNNMYNIQIIQYVMVLYNVTEIKYTDIIKINKQLQTLKKINLKRCNTFYFIKRKFLH